MKRRISRLLSFEECEDLVRRSGGQDLLLFLDRLDFLHRKYRKSHQQLLAILLRMPKETDFSGVQLQKIRHSLAEEGKEYTPDEITKIVEKICCKIRNRLRDCGWIEDQILESDVQLMEMLKHDKFYT